MRLSGVERKAFLAAIRREICDAIGDQKFAVLARTIDVILHEYETDDLRAVRPEVPEVDPAALY
jgi:hypothetical protein